MPIDQQTDRFKLDLPNEANTLKHDVARLIDSFNTLDEKAAKLDDDGHVSLDQLPDTIAKLTGAGFIKDEQIPTKVPLMDAKGKLSISNIPEQALMTVFDAPSEVMMLELDPAPTIGDVCNITTTPFKQYLLVKADPTKRDSWRELPVSAVTSVNGQTGDITVASAGENSDITSLKALSGPLTLGGEGLNDYDAVTVKQLRAMSGGSGSPTMNGVVGNFIGAVEWFSGISRLNIPVGYIPADGGLYNRADYPELWALISSGVLNATLESNWLLHPTERGKFSLGDGNATTGTTFRAPDLNGMFKAGTPAGGLSSIGSVFLRGSNTSEAVGAIKENAAPNIVGEVEGRNSGTYAGLFSNSRPGALSTDTAPRDGGEMAAPGLTTTTLVGDRNRVLRINASKSNIAYGRDGTTEVRPNMVHGIWIIRASASFQAANSSFEINNGDAAMPGAGKAIAGGTLNSRYMVAGKTVGVAFLRMVGTIGSAYSARIGVSTNLDGVTTTKNLDFNNNGDMNLPGSLNVASDATANSNGNVNIKNGSYYSSRVYPLTGTPKAGTVFTGSGIWMSGDQATIGNKRMQSAIYTELVWGGVTRTMISTYNAEGPATKYWFFNSDGSTAGPNGVIQNAGSDRKLKDNIHDAADGALDRILAIRRREFSWKSDKRKDRGYIAQELQAIDPLYVYESLGHRPGDEVLNVSMNALISDLIGAMQTLTSRVAELEALIPSRD